MNLDVVMPIILTASAKILSQDDMDLVFELLAHNELGLAIELICDKLAEYNSILPESLGLKLQFVATQLMLDPLKTWEGLIIEENHSHQLRRMYREGADLNSYIETIFHGVCDKLNSDSIRRIREFLDYDELDLAIDSLCYGLISGKIEISKIVLNRIRTVLLDLGRDPDEWKGFVIKEKE
jgi:hypothetical protein